MINAVVLDVDGVIVGEREGFNFPDPNNAVIDSLKKLRQSGIFVSLCTGRPAFGIKEIISSAYLNNLHITEGGAVGIDTIDKQVSFQYSLDRKKILEMVRFYLKNDIYIEFYTSTDYFVLKSQVNDLTRKHAIVLQREPQLIDDIAPLLKANDIVKILLASEFDTGKNLIISTFNNKFGKELDLNWTMNANLLPWKFALVTLNGVSKRKGVENISKFLKVPLENILGVGDTMHDWQFIEICGYGATLEGSDKKLMELVSKKNERGFIGGNVNENGILDILKHFGLI